MSTWNELRKWASENGLFKMGMTAEDIEGLKAQADAAPVETLTVEDIDLSVDRGRPDERVEQETIRGKRTPMGGFRQQLSGGYERPGYYYHWFTDNDDRLLRAQQAGFERPSEEDDDYVPPRTVNKRSSSPEKGVKMRQKMDYHLEDQAYKHRQIDSNEQGIYNHEQGMDGSKTPSEFTYGESTIDNQFKR